MQFSKKTESSVKPLIPLIKKCGLAKHLKSTSNSNIKNVESKMYNDIKEGFSYAEKLRDSGKIEPTLSVDTQMPTTYDTKYFPQNIKSFITSNLKYQLTYNFTIKHRTITIAFALFSENDIINIHKFSDHVTFMIAWLYICSKYSDRICSNALSIYVYLTPIKKELPSKKTIILNAQHINTAFTYHCIPQGEIVLYREEEWKKVFIHEAYHSFGLDFGNYQKDSIRQNIYRLFPVKSEFELTETYTETWARIVHTAFVSYSAIKNKNKNNENEFSSHFNIALEIERLYSIKKLIIVLQFMGLKYTDLYKRNDACLMLRNNLFREETNVLAYYVLTGILMNDYKGFLSWCSSHNVNLYKFDKTPYNMASFISLFKTNHDTKSLRQTITCIINEICKVEITNSMRMTVLEMIT